MVKEVKDIFWVGKYIMSCLVVCITKCLFDRKCFPTWAEIMTIQTRLLLLLNAALGILERNSKFYEPIMPIIVLNTLLSFSHYISHSQIGNWISKVLSKFSRITEMMEPGLKSRTVCFHKLCSFCYPARLK